MSERFIAAKCPKCRFKFKIELPAKKLGKGRRLRVMLEIINFIVRNYPNGLSIQHLYGIFKEKYGFKDGIIRGYIADMVKLKMLEKPDPACQFYVVCKEGVR